MDNNEEELEKILDEVGDPLPAGAPIDITKIEPPIVEEPVEEPVVEEPVVQDITPIPPADLKPADPVQIDGAQLLKQYLNVYERFLYNYDSDREQIEKTIKHLENIVFNVGGAQRVHVEMLVAALRTKAETNGNVVKALDSIAKILAASKGTQVLINNNNGAGTQVDLRALLDAPLYPDEKRKMERK